MDFSDWVYGEKLKAYKKKLKLVKIHYNSITYITDLNSMFVLQDLLEMMDDHSATQSHGLANQTLYMGIKRVQ